MIDCGQPTDTTIVVEDTQYGDTATFPCDSRNTVNVTCLPSGHWSNYTIDCSHLLHVSSSRTHSAPSSIIHTRSLPRSTSSLSTNSLSTLSVPSPIPTIPAMLLMTVDSYPTPSAPAALLTTIDSLSLIIIIIIISALLASGAVVTIVGLLVGYKYWQRNKTRQNFRGTVIIIPLPNSNLNLIL